MPRLMKNVDTFGALPPLPRVLPQNWDQIILNENFSSGFNGWHTHTASFPPYLSDHAFQQSRQSLKLTTGNASQSANGGSNSIYKRLGGNFRDGYMFFGGWLAFRGAAERSNPARITLAMDHQLTDDSARSFNRLVLRRWAGATESFSPRWSLVPDQIPTTPASGVFVDVPNTAAATYPATAGVGAVPGWNVNHGDYWFAGLLVSLNQSDNTAGAGVGRYWRSYFGDQAFDLSTLLTNSHVTDDGGGTQSGAGTGTGSGAEPPQVDSVFGGSGAPNAASSFSNGFNVGITMDNRVSGAFGEAAVFAGHLFACHFPAGTTFPIGLG